MKQINPTRQELNQLIEDHDLQLIINNTPSSNETFKNGNKLLHVVFAPCGSYWKVFINF